MCWKQVKGNDTNKNVFSPLVYAKDRDQLTLRDVQVCIPFQYPDVYYLNFGKK